MPLFALEIALEKSTLLNVDLIRGGDETRWHTAAEDIGMIQNGPWLPKAVQGEWVRDDARKPSECEFNFTIYTVSQWH